MRNLLGSILLTALAATAYEWPANVTQQFVSETNQQWAVTDDSVSLRYNGTSWDTLALLAGQDVRLIHQTTPEKVWFSCSSAVYCFTDGDAGAKVSDAGLTLEVSKRSQSTPSNLWASDGESVAHFNGNHWTTHVEHYVPLNPGGHFDYDQVVAVGDSSVFLRIDARGTYGAFFYTGTHWMHYQAGQDPFDLSYVKTIFQDDAGGAWFDHYNTYKNENSTHPHLSHYDGTEWHYFHLRGVQKLWGIDSTSWLTSAGKLYRHEGDSLRNVGSAPNAMHQWVAGKTAKLSYSNSSVSLSFWEDTTFGDALRASYLPLASSYVSHVVDSARTVVWCIHDNTVVRLNMQSGEAAYFSAELEGIAAPMSTGALDAEGDLWVNGVELKGDAAGATPDASLVTYGGDRAHLLSVGQRFTAPYNYKNPYDLEVESWLVEGPSWVEAKEFGLGLHYKLKGVPKSAENDTIYLGYSIGDKKDTVAIELTINRAPRMSEHIEKTVLSYSDGRTEVSVQFEIGYNTVRAMPLDSLFTDADGDVVSYSNDRSKYVSVVGDTAYITAPDSAAGVSYHKNEIIALDYTEYKSQDTTYHFKIRFAGATQTVKTLPSAAGFFSAGPAPFAPAEEVFRIYSKGAVSGDATLRICDHVGSVVAVVRGHVDEQWPLYWDGRNRYGLRVASGVYRGVLEVETPAGEKRCFILPISVKE